MKKRRGICIGVVIAIVVSLLLVIVTPALAAIAHPDTLTINSVYAYQSCLETDDQLYLIEYTVDYDGEYPAAYPDEDITEAFLTRLMYADTTDLGSTAPYAYYQIGYGQGIAAIYFSADDAPPYWESELLSIELTGNPTLDWGESIPTTTVYTFDGWLGVSSLASRILYLADLLELAWEVDMIETTAIGSCLTTYGEAYFTNAIPNLRVMCPSVFSSGMESADFNRRDVSDTTYADLLRDQWDGTWLDTGDTADNLGVDKIWITGMIFMATMLVITYIIVRRTGSYKPIMLVFIILVPIGARLGFIPILAPAVVAFLCLAAIGYAIFYRHSSA